ncbi:MAG TPA: OsmC family protein [Acidobacteriaceae bacterium]|nr:OsmC family protein [Acidobacteriaceae bacterium]
MSILKILLQHNGGARFTADARHHRIVLDQPTEDGATDQGMSPAELLLISLGGCVGEYVAQYLKTRALSAEGLSVQVEAEPSPHPLHFGDFHVEVLVPNLNERHLRALEKSFPAGLVQNAVRFENVLRVTTTAGRNDEKQL